MIIHYHFSPDKPMVERLTMFVAPAALLDNASTPVDWIQKVGNEERPKEFTVEFFHGQAEVEDRLGAWMVETGLARKSRLVIPAPWER